MSDNLDVDTCIQLKYVRFYIGLNLDVQIGSGSDLLLKNGYESVPIKTWIRISNPGGRGDILLYKQSVGRQQPHRKQQQ